MKIGVFGGRFDPFHSAHLEIITRGLTVHGLDIIHIVPSASPPHKPVSAPFDDRCEMVALALDSAGLPRNRIVIDRREWSQQQAPSWTVDTIMGVRADYPSPHELWLMIGDDTVLQLHTWYCASALLTQVNLLVFNRNKVSTDDITHHLHFHFPSFAGQIVCDSDIDIPISSSILRDQTHSPYIDAHVTKYIYQRGLYLNPPKYVLGITGRVGSGKSAATAYIERHFNVTVADLDIIGHRLLLDAPIKAEIRELFGDIVFDGDTINRKVLGKIVFSNPAALQELNHITHPKIREAVVRAITSTPNSVVLIVGALLEEIGVLALCKTVWVIDSEDDAIQTAIGSKFDIHHSQQSRTRYQAQGTVIKNTFDDRFFDTLDPLFRTIYFS